MGKTWPYYPEYLSEILPDDILSILQSGCAVKAGRPLLIAEENDGEIRFIQPIDPRQNYESFCYRLRGPDPRHSERASSHPDGRCQGLAGGNDACVKFDTKHAQHVLLRSELGEEIREERVCHMGLIDLARVIRVMGRPVAVLFSGQFADELSKRRILARIDTYQRRNRRIRAYGSEWQSLKEAVDLLRAVTDDDRRMLSQIAQEIGSFAEDRYKLLRYREEHSLLSDLRDLFANREIRTFPELWDVTNEVMEQLLRFCNVNHITFFAATDDDADRLELRAWRGSVPKNLDTDRPYALWSKVEGYVGPRANEPRLLLFSDEVPVSPLLTGRNTRFLHDASCALPVSVSGTHRAILFMGKLQDPSVRAAEEYESLRSFLHTVGFLLIGQMHALSLAAGQRIWSDSAAEVAHAVRASLNPISTEVGLMRAYIEGEGYVDRDRAIRSSDIIKNEIDDLKFISKERLTDFRLEADGSPSGYVFESMPVILLAERIRGRYTATAERNGLTIVVDPMLDLAGDVEVDKARMFLALSYIVDNAVKYAHSNTEIRIGGGRLGDYVRIWVSDYGTGILEEDIPRIFDRGYRGIERGRRQRSEGSGLGLWYCRMIVRAHGGSISCDSRSGPRDSASRTAEGYKTTFIISIPLRQAIQSGKGG